MRLFVAVDLDETLRRAAARAARSVRDELERSDTFGVSWVGPDNFHLTLRFLGEVSDDVAARLQERLAEPFALAPFDLVLSGTGTFPPSGSARVIWLGVTGGGAALQALHGEVEQRLAPFGFPREDRPYRAHLTIARFRVPAPARIRHAVAAGHSGSIGSCTVRDVTLYRSQLSPRGAVYTALARGPLAGTVS